VPRRQIGPSKTVSGDTDGAVRFRILDLYVHLLERQAQHSLAQKFLQDALTEAIQYV